jgi:hypothetical protein
VFVMVLQFVNAMLDIMLMAYARLALQEPIVLPLVPHFHLNVLPALPAPIPFPEQESHPLVLPVLPAHMPPLQEQLPPPARLVLQEPIVLPLVPHFRLNVLTALPVHIPFQEQESHLLVLPALPAPILY